MKLLKRIAYFRIDLERKEIINKALEVQLIEMQQQAIRLENGIKNEETLASQSYCEYDGGDGCTKNVILPKCFKCRHYLQ